jgi:hypothetical protein
MELSVLALTIEIDERLREGRARDQFGRCTMQHVAQRLVLLDGQLDLGPVAAGTLVARRVARSRLAPVALALLAGLALLLGRC